MGFLTVRDISERLKVAPYTVCEYLKSGKLKGVKIGGKHWRVSEASLQNFIDSCETEQEEKRHDDTRINED